MQIRKQFPFKEFEPKWQGYWDANTTFRASNPFNRGQSF
jgi:leucyl-tRNA synthetase